MRTVVASVVIALIALTGVAQAQDKGYKLSSVTFGAGENPITSGLSGTMALSNEKGGYLEVTLQQEQAWVMGGKDFVSHSGNTTCSLYWSVGFFQSAPWVGPWASCNRTLGHFGKKGADGKGSQKVTVGAMTWPGFYFGKEPRNWETKNDGVKNPESLLAGWFEVGSLNVGPVGFSVAHLNFLDDPSNILPGMSYTHGVRKDLDVTGSVTWNTNGKRAMYFIGGTYQPKK